MAPSFGVELRPIGLRDTGEIERAAAAFARETRHHVTMSRDTCERLTAGKYTPEHCLEVLGH